MFVRKDDCRQLGFNVWALGAAAALCWLWGQGRFRQAPVATSRPDVPDTVAESDSLRPPWAGLGKPGQAFTAESVIKGMPAPALPWLDVWAGARVQLVEELPQGRHTDNRQSPP